MRVPQERLSHQQEGRVEKSQREASADESLEGGVQPERGANGRFGRAHQTHDLDLVAVESRASRIADETERIAARARTTPRKIPMPRRIPTASRNRRAALSSVSADSTPGQTRLSAARADADPGRAVERRKTSSVGGNGGSESPDSAAARSG